MDNQGGRMNNRERMNNIVLNFERVCITGSQSEDPSVLKQCHDMIEKYHEQSMPYEFCRSILMPPNRHPTAKFFAAKILERAIVREWDILEHSQKASVCNFVVNLVVNRSVPENTIKSLIHCFAVIQKRGWTGKNSNFYQDLARKVIKRFLESDKLEEKAYGMKYVLELIVEFSISNSQMRMSWKLHEIGRFMFQKNLLPFCMQSCLSFLRTILSQPNFSDNDTIVKILGNALKVLHEIIKWDFNANYDKYQLHFSEKTPDKVVVNDEWKNIIINPDLVDILLRLHDRIRSFSHVTKLIRNSFIELCKARGKNEEEMTPSRFHFFDILVQGCLHLCSGAMELAKTNTRDAEQELVDGCECFWLLTMTYRYHIWVRLKRFPEVLRKFVQLTLFLNQRQFQFTEELSNSFQNLLNGWSCLSEDYRPSSSTDTILPRECYRLFEAFVCTKFNRKPEDVEVYDSEMFVDETMDSLAVLARMNVGKSIGLLQTRLSSLLQRLSQIGKVTGPPPNTRLMWEEMDWLLEIGTHVTCDVNDLDIAEVPENVMFFLQSLPRNQPMNGVTKFFHEVFRVVAAYSNRQLSLPSMILEKLLYFVKHWSYTYLLCDWSEKPENHFIPIVADLYCGKRGEALCELVLKFMLCSLLNTKHKAGSNEGDPEYERVQKFGRNTGLFFFKLTNNEEVETYFIEKSVIFKEMIRKDNNTIFEFPQYGFDVHCLLTRALCNCSLTNEMWMKILVPLKNQFIQVLQDPAFRERFRHPNSVRKVLYCLHKFVAISRSLSIENLELLIDFFKKHNFFENFLKLLNIYQQNEDVVAVIINFFQEFTTNLFFKEFLNLNLYQGLFRYCLRLIEFIIGMHKNAQSQKNNNNNGNNSMEKRQEEFMMDNVQELIRILINISLRDILCMESFNRRSNGDMLPYEEIRQKMLERKPYVDILNHLGIHNHVFKGIHFILSCVKFEKISEYREVCMVYYQLMSHIFGWVFVEKVSKLPSNILNVFVSSVFYGLRDMSKVINSYCLSIVKNIVEKSNIFFIPKNNQQPPLNHYLFMKEMFKILIFVKINEDLVEEYATILYPLIFLNLGNYRMLTMDFAKNVRVGKEINVQTFFKKLLMNISPNNSNEQNKKNFFDSLKMFMNIRLYVRKM